MDIMRQISQKGADKEKLAAAVVKSPEVLPQLLEGLNSTKGSIRLGCEKILRLISSQHPELIYPYFDVFVKMLDSDNNCLRWGAIITIANLVIADKQSRFDDIFEQYYSLIMDKAMITASNVIRSSPTIVAARPELSDKISREILKVEKAKYENKGVLSPECSNVAFGHAIDSFDAFFELIQDKKTVIQFVKKQLKNTRISVNKKATAFLKKNEINL